eukprot:6832715-Lingulodinium_polyedra.AAC.1
MALPWGMAQAPLPPALGQVAPSAGPAASTARPGPSLSEAGFAQVTAAGPGAASATRPAQERFARAIVAARAEA